MADLDRYSPQTSVIGAILLWPDLMGEAMLALSDQDFEDKSCRIVWQAMTRLFREGQKIDIILLKDMLSGIGNVPEFLVSCMDSAPHETNFRAHVQALKRQSMLQRLKDLGSVLADCTDLDEALDLLAKGNEISVRSAARERRSMEVMMRSFGERHSSNVSPDFLQWPFNPLNKGLNVSTGKFVILGGYPSDGKTAFALNSALVQARAGKRVGFYSLETDSNTIEDRAIASIILADLQKIQRNSLTDRDWEQYAARADVAEWPFDVISASGMTVDDIRADALAHRYQVIYIDYLQLISPGRHGRYYSRVDEVSQISIQLQRVAKTTDINVCALSQLSRPESKSGKVPPPNMHSLRETGQIEQDADVIMLIWRENPDDVRANRFLKVAKNKEGLTGSWTLAFDGVHQRFGWDTTLSAESMGRWPEHRNPLRQISGNQNQSSFFDTDDQYRILDGRDPDCPF